jgi:hypothetical protein
MPKIFGREPALWLALLAVIVKLSTAFGLDLTDKQQAVINAAAAALVGVLVAISVHDGISETAVTGYSQLTNDLQEERDALRVQVTELHQLRAADQAEITRLRIENARLGGPT